MKWNTLKIHRSKTLLKKLLFSETLQSSKCIQIVLVFRAWVAFLKKIFAIQYLRKFDFLNFKLTYLAWKSNREPISSRKQLGKIENLYSWNSLFKNLNFKTLKLFSTSKKLQSSNCLLEKLNCFANWSNLWAEWVNFKTSELK